MDYLLNELTTQVAAYREWMDANTDDQGDPLNPNNYADYDEQRTDWWEALALSAIDIADTYKRETE